ENAFKALELGALDFVAKPDRFTDPELDAIREELVKKVLLTRAMRMPAPRGAPMPAESVRSPRPAAVGARPGPGRVIAIASSTGGPSALIEVFSRLPSGYPHGVVIAQHMPDKFTRTFAERLDRRRALGVSEAQDHDVLYAGTAFVCPGRHCMDLEAAPRGRYRVRVGPAAESDRYVPSADRLLRTAALSAGSRAVGVVLTGMGDDGVAGARGIMEAGGIVLAESETTAVVYGMPGAAVRAGVVTWVLPLGEIAAYLARL